MEALIVTGGENPSPEIVRIFSKSADYIIAADSGLEACLEAQIEPDLVIGDFDSVSRELLLKVKNDKVIEFSEDKDFTDTELAIQAGRDHGAERIVLVGGGAGRLDHILAVRSLFERQTPINEWHTGHESAYFLPSTTTLEFESPIGSLVSLFPFAQGAKGMHSIGLKWPLDGLVWDCSHFGISNRSVQEKVAISSGPNPILVILPLGTRIFLTSSRAVFERSVEV